MSWIIRRVLVVLRVCILAVVVYLVWPALSAVVAHRTTWAQGVDAIFTNRVIALVVVVLVIGLALSLLRSPLVRVAVGVGTVLLVAGIVTGRLSPSGVEHTVKSYVGVSALQGAAARCGYPVNVQHVDNQVRVVLKSTAGAQQVLGYAAHMIGNKFISIVDTTGHTVRLPCRGH